MLIEMTLTMVLVVPVGIPDVWPYRAHRILWPPGLGSKGTGSPSAGVSHKSG